MTGRFIKKINNDYFIFIFREENSISYFEMYINSDLELQLTFKAKYLNNKVFLEKREIKQNCGTKMLKMYNNDFEKVYNESFYNLGSDFKKFINLIVKTKEGLLNA